MAGSDGTFAIEQVSSIRAVAAAEWNGLVTDGDPFMRHEFLTALETSGCIGAGTRQLRRSVGLVSLLTGTVSGVAGLLLGFAVAAALRALINTGTFAGQLPGHSFTLTPRTVIAVLIPWIWMSGCRAVPRGRVPATLKSMSP